jgi:D-3-phosphoglycerate dehydrogenase
MYTVFLSAPYLLPFIDRFQEVFQHYGLEILIPEGVEERLKEEDILKYAGEFDGVICGDDPYTAQAIAACVPRLRVISKWGTGIDSIDGQACRQHGIMIGNTPNAFTNPVADTVLGYLLAFVRRQPWMDHSMKNGIWDKIPGKTLGECTLGVIGVGQIGKAVLRRASAFGMTLLGNDIVEVDPHFVMDFRVMMTGLEDLLKRSDFVSLNTDLNPSSHHLINHKTLSMMKRTAVLINTSRGKVVKEMDLIQALEDERIAGAALDVFEVEPLPLDSPLRQMANVLLAPHNANSSPVCWERVHWNTIRNLIVGLGLDPADLQHFRNRLDA